MVAPWRQLQKKDLCEFKASLVYKANSRTARFTQRDPHLKTTNKKQIEKEKLTSL